MAIKIGDTPIVKLESLSRNNADFFAKLEFYNPFGSVKDRAAYWMIKMAEEGGLVKRGHTIIIEPTSGNTGIALAGIAKILGYKVEIVIPEKASDETKKIIESLGATLYQTTDDLCPKVGAGTDQSIALARSIASARPDKYYSPNQYANEANFMGHYKGTGPEIWEQTQGKITHFFTGVGTGGTITGIGAYLKEKNPNIKIIAVQPQQNHLIQGLRNFEESSKPDLFIKREQVVDDWVTITNEEAFASVKEILKKEKMLVSPSSATVYTAMKKYDISNGCVVGIFADDGRKFKSLYTQQKILTESEYDSALENSKYISKVRE
ncbi:MAG: cysteine synthase family protein [Thaumarchaeota archaeon]|nr:cysteine synthase family protein [Nitrososphaerota archaeon]MDE1830769.1 cysteine synthase family protein [Nitrososphaerota archaeon]MDE1840819.1 cysteine synthase family protein [Nitrososphaerota archaeon]MDE1877005.1 cysteine synthase family protein [Nitrososphaerota archaeon]